MKFYLKIYINFSANDSLDSDSDSEEKETEGKIGLQIAELTSEITVKQKLIEELEMSQRRLHTMRQHYEDKLLQLEERIRATQNERDKVLSSISKLILLYYYYYHQ